MIWNPRSPFPLARLVEEFSDRLLAVDLPALPAERRGETVAFAGRRIATLPSPMRARAHHGCRRRRRCRSGSPAAAASSRLLAGRPLPVVGDYVRLVRSLAYAYVWETWPSTAADGAAR